MRRRPTESSTPCSTLGWRSRSRETPGSERARTRMAVQGSHQPAYRHPAIAATRSANGGSARIFIFAAKIDQPLLPRRDRALHRRIVDPVIHLVLVGFQVIKFPFVEPFPIQDHPPVPPPPHPNTPAHPRETR